MNMTNKVNIEFLRTQLEKALDDVEELKDKVRARMETVMAECSSTLMFVRRD